MLDRNELVVLTTTSYTTVQDAVTAIDALDRTLPDGFIEELLEDATVLARKCGSPVGEPDLILHELAVTFYVKMRHGWLDTAEDAPHIIADTSHGAAYGYLRAESGLLTMVWVPKIAALAFHCALREKDENGMKALTKATARWMDESTP
ncbi:hypothetical protein ACVLV4_000430 [Rathayibacter agropyri]